MIKKININIIAAFTKNAQVIGDSKNNKIPWHYTEDLKFFKRITMGKPIIMGRKTFESLGSKPLPGRENMVLTNNINYVNNKIKIFHNKTDCLNYCNTQNFTDIFIIGGAGLYTEFLPIADILYLTIINKNYTGDIYFPTFNWQSWNIQELDNLHTDFDILKLTKKNN